MTKGILYQALSSEKLSGLDMMESNNVKKLYAYINSRTKNKLTPSFIADIVSEYILEFNSTVINGINNGLPSEYSITTIVNEDRYRSGIDAYRKYKFNYGNRVYNHYTHFIWCMLNILFRLFNTICEKQNILLDLKDNDDNCSSSGIPIPRVNSVILDGIFGLRSKLSSLESYRVGRIINSYFKAFRLNVNYKSRFKLFESIMISLSEYDPIKDVYAVSSDSKDCYDLSDFIRGHFHIDTVVDTNSREVVNHNYYVDNIFRCVLSDFNNIEGIDNTHSPYKYEYFEIHKLTHDFAMRLNQKYISPHYNGYIYNDSMSDFIYSTLNVEILSMYNYIFGVTNVEGNTAKKTCCLELFKQISSDVSDILLHSKIYSSHGSPHRNVNECKSRIDLVLLRLFNFKYVDTYDIRIANPDIFNKNVDVIKDNHSLLPLMVSSLDSIVSTIFDGNSQLHSASNLPDKINKTITVINNTKDEIFLDNIFNYVHKIIKDQKSVIDIYYLKELYTLIGVVISRQIELSN